ncbi:MAG: MBL fold metallo-hydrolase, partial [Bacteroidota bacterium]
HATRSLCAIMLLDSAKIQERDAEYYNKRLQKRRKGKAKDHEMREPLYTAQDAHNTMNLFNGYAYERWFSIRPGVDVLFRDAGHILGSASVTLKIQEGGKTHMIGFSGDVGRPDRPILRDPIPMPELDYLICESTYGNKEHLGKPDEIDKFLHVIEETCLEKKGKLIIPAFSVGRTQEIVYMLDQLETHGKLPRIPVYVDSPLAVNATTVFGSHPECYDKQLNEYLLIDDNPFGFNNLTYVRDVEISKSLNQSTEPMIIISASGMMTAGRIRHHAFNNISKSNTTFLMVGYCSPDSLGGQLRAGKEVVRIFGEEKVVHANVEIMDSFSAHADRSELIDFTANQRRTLKNMFLVHGTPDRQAALAASMQESGIRSVHVPKLGEEIVI